jgi:hypothetical protein
VRDHDDCDERMVRAQDDGRFGYAEFLAAKCDLFHRDRPTTARTQLHPTHDEESAHV